MIDGGILVVHTITRVLCSRRRVCGRECMRACALHGTCEAPFLDSVDLTQCRGSELSKIFQDWSRQLPRALDSIGLD